jgi:predicted DsbA family dithiol-disulfide isomerase
MLSRELAEHALKPIDGTLNLDLWSDIVCPWCWIGKRRLELALDHAGLADRAQWRFHAYELGAREQKPQPVIGHLAQKYGVTLEEARAMTARVASLGAEVGLVMNMDRCISAPTYDAHRLVQWAQSQGAAPKLMEALHQAHFTQGLDVSDHGLLAGLAQQCGLNKVHAEDVLKSDAFADGVEADLQRAQDYEISGVPFTVVKDRWVVQGAQSVAVFEQALLKAA